MCVCVCEGDRKRERESVWERERNAAIKSASWEKKSKSPSLPRRNNDADHQERERETETERERWVMREGWVRWRYASRRGLVAGVRDEETVDGAEAVGSEEFQCTLRHDAVALRNYRGNHAGRLGWTEAMEGGGENDSTRLHHTPSAILLSSSFSASSFCIAPSPPLPSTAAYSFLCRHRRFSLLCACRHHRRPSCCC